MIDDNPLLRSMARAIDGVVSRAVQGADAAGWNSGADLDRFREVREKTLATLGPLSVPQASWSPEPGKWSIMQIADHLLRADEMFREQALRLIEVAEQGGLSIDITLSEVDVGFPGIPREVAPLFELPMRMVNLFVPHVLRETVVRHPIVPSLSARSTQPREGLILGKLRQDLANSHEETETLLAMPLPLNLDELTINHPVMGSNTIPQLFRILIAHEQRHHDQMARLQAHAGFPRASREPMSAADVADLFGGAET
jgi:hypothetical protein